MASAIGSPLGKDTVHLWWARADALGSRKLKDRYFHELSEDEQARYHRFMFQKDSDLFLATRALCRKTLSTYIPIEPESWGFVANHYGKPAVETPEEGRFLEFNLTNTPGFVAMVVSDQYPVGIDAEAIDRGSSTLEIASRFFSVQEFEELQGHPPEEIPARFFHYWTLKEAYIKVRGMGMSIPLADFSMVEDPEGRITVVHHTEGAHTGYHWHFEQYKLGGNYLLGLGVRLPKRSYIEVQIRELTL